MQKLTCPLVLDAIMTCSPLVKDVIEIIQTYLIKLYNAPYLSRGLCIWEEDTLISIDQRDIPAWWEKDTCMSIKSCFSFEPANMTIPRSPFFLGQLHFANLFLYRASPSLSTMDHQLVWTISSNLDALLLKMSPEHFESFLLYQRSRRLSGDQDTF